ncbi:MAG: SocA family protein [Candidatus Latescibacteria bacterium]|nr:SocA family protein [Candidatus Latescibacterota bacterium]
MIPRLKKERAIELTTWILQWGGGSMDIMKLLKLIYITERRALERYGWPVTFDSLASLDRGPVPSKIYDLIKGTYPDPADQRLWNEWIGPRDGNQVCLLQPPKLNHLSESQLELAREVFEEFGDERTFVLSELTHAFPEWIDPKGSSLPISYKELLSKLGKPQEEIQAILDELDEEARLEELFQS